MILAVLGSACWHEPSPEERVGSARGAATAVTWTNLVNALATPDSNDLTKTGSSYAWDAGAASVQIIEHRGYVEFTTAENNKNKAAGLSHSDSGQGYDTIDYAIYLHSDGTVTIREGGDHKGSFGTYAAGDVFRVEVAKGKVTYSKNGAAPFYSSESTPSFPLLLDTALHGSGATICDATMTTPPPVTWTTPLVGASATPDSNDLTKTGSANAWDAGAASVETIERRGYVEFTTAENNKTKAAGLSNGDSGQTLDDIDYAIYLRATGAVEIREGGVDKGSFGSYVAGDVFRVEVANGKVTYSKNGQPPFYTSNATPILPLRLDTALYGPGATIRDATMTSTKLHVSTQQTELPTDPPGLLTCGQNDVVTLSGFILLQQENDPEVDDSIEFQAFLNKTQLEVQNRIQTFLTSDGAAMEDFDGYLVLDIERPGPKGLWNHSNSDKNKIVDAYIRRINAARVKFPKAKIGLFQTLNPDEQGVAGNSDYQNRLAALIEAGKSGVRWGQTAQEAGGLYCNLSFLAPVLYVRYGCDLSDLSPCDPEWSTLAAYTRLGITGSQQLDSRLPLLPFLTVYVPLGPSTSFDDWMLLDLHPPDSVAALEATIGAQLDMLAEYNVVDAALWIGNSDLYDDVPAYLGPGRNDPPVQWTIDDYACDI